VYLNIWDANLAFDLQRSQRPLFPHWSPNDEVQEPLMEITGPMGSRGNGNKKIMEWDGNGNEVVGILENSNNNIIPARLYISGHRLHQSANLRTMDPFCSDSRFYCVLYVI